MVEDKCSEEWEQLPIDEICSAINDELVLEGVTRRCFQAMLRVAKRMFQECGFNHSSSLRLDPLKNGDIRFASEPEVDIFAMSSFGGNWYAVASPEAIRNISLMVSAASVRNDVINIVDSANDHHCLAKVLSRSKTFVRHCVKLVKISPKILAGAALRCFQDLAEMPIRYHVQFGSKSENMEMWLFGDYKADRRLQAYANLALTSTSLKLIKSTFLSIDLTSLVKCMEIRNDEKVGACREISQIDMILRSPRGNSHFLATIKPLLSNKPSDQELWEVVPSRSCS